MIEERTTAATDKLASTFARRTYAHYFQFVRNKDVKNTAVHFACETKISVYFAKWHK